MSETQRDYFPSAMHEPHSDTYLPVVLYISEDGSVMDQSIYGPGFKTKREAVAAARRMCDLKQQIFDEAFQIVDEGFAHDPPQ